MEKDITLDLARRLRTLLQKERVKVVLTRSGDQYVEISERWNRVHASGARLFVSLHVNAFDGDPSINGATIFYPKSDSLPFAQAVDAALGQSLKPYQVADDGVAPKPELWVHSDIPTVTVEPAYLTNAREASLLEQGLRKAFSAVSWPPTRRSRRRTSKSLAPKRPSRRSTRPKPPLRPMPNER